MGVRLKAFLVAVLALSLLAAPCIAILAPLGGAAYAAHLTIDAAGAHGAHGDAHLGTHPHDHAHSQHHGGPPAAPPHDQTDCCCACDGWLVAKSAKQPVAQGVASLPRPAYEALVTGPVPASQLAGPVRDGRNITAFAGDHSRALGAGPVYAVTSRLRI